MAHILIGVRDKHTGEMVAHQVLSADAGELLVEKWQERLMRGRSSLCYTTVVKEIADVATS